LYPDSENDGGDNEDSCFFMEVTFLIQTSTFRSILLTMDDAAIITNTNMATKATKKQVTVNNKAPESDLDEFSSEILQ